MKIKRILLALVIVLISAPMLFSATYYDNGNQRFTITAGPVFPLTLTSFYTGNTTVGFGESGTHQSLGGYGSISYQIFMNDYVSVGGEVGYAFNFAISDDLVTIVPFQAKVTYFPLQGKVDIPISFGIGGAYLSLADAGSHIALFASLETGVDYYITDNWGVGIKSGIWAIPELFFNSSSTPKNYLATYVPVTLAVTYRQ